MKDKIAQFKLKVIRFVAQRLADVITRRAQLCIDLEDQDSFDLLNQHAAILNAYCIVFYDIYLD